MDHGILELDIWVLRGIKRPYFVAEGGLLCLEHDEGRVQEQGYFL